MAFSMGGGTDGASHDCYATFNRIDGERNVNVNRNDNDWNDNWSFAGVPQPSSFPGTFWNLGMCRVLFYELPLPTSEHLADLVAGKRKGDVFFVVERFAFPKDEQQEFYGVEFAYRDSQIWQFLLFGQKCARRHHLHHLDKKNIYFCTDRVLVNFR